MDGGTSTRPCALPALGKGFALMCRRKKGGGWRVAAQRSHCIGNRDRLLSPVPNTTFGELANTAAYAFSRFQIEAKGARIFTFFTSLTGNFFTVL
ncbi:MAG: hypothetical protein HYZ45_00875 [Burkholderiales bacterium]|nr:hypothetical protein [Burkholderiales bacterium]